MAHTRQKSISHKRVFLHSSSVLISGKALLFLGHSTSGKSTISSILADRYRILADDKVLIQKDKNGVWVVNDGCPATNQKEPSPCSSRDKIGYPLFAIVRIFKSNTTEITPLTPRETCRYVADAIFEIDVQRRENNLELLKRWFFLAAEISREVNGWRLFFRKDNKIVDFLKDSFENERQ